MGLKYEPASELLHISVTRMPTPPSEGGEGGVGMIDSFRSVVVVDNCSADNS